MAAFPDYAALLPPDRLVVRGFKSQDLVGGDIATDFFHLLPTFSGRKMIPEVSVERRNESLCGAATLWLLSSNALGPFEGVAARRRIGLYDALRANQALKALPMLEMTDPEIARAARIDNRETLDWLNADQLAQSPLETAPPDAEALPAPELRDRFRHRLLSCGRRDHMKLVIRAAMRHGSGKGA